MDLKKKTLGDYLRLKTVALIFSNALNVRVNDAVTPDLRLHFSGQNSAMEAL